MSFFSWAGSVIKGVGDFFGGSSGSYSHSSTSSSQTLYEPDRVRVAELELQRTHLDNQRADRMIEGQKEIIELNAQMQGMIIEAHAKGLEHSVNVLKSLMNDMNLMAQQQLTLLENGHFEIVKNIETLYLSFEQEVQKDNRNFQLQQLPAMFEALSKFPENSTAHTMYAGSIDKQIALNFDFISNKLQGLAQRQRLLIESSVASKQFVLEHSAQLVRERMAFLDTQLEHQKSLGTVENALPFVQPLKQLPSSVE